MLSPFRPRRARPFFFKAQFLPQLATAGRTAPALQTHLFPERLRLRLLFVFASFCFAFSRRPLAPRDLLLPSLVPVRCPGKEQVVFPLSLSVSQLLLLIGTPSSEKGQSFNFFPDAWFSGFCSKPSDQRPWPRFFFFLGFCPCFPPAKEQDPPPFSLVRACLFQTFVGSPPQTPRPDVVRGWC